jgi:hypothetical protein
MRRKVRRETLIALAEKLPPCVVGMEACCGAHHLGRVFAAHGHNVRLMSPEYVRPYIKAQKNDDRDAEGIAEAANRSPLARTGSPQSTPQRSPRSRRRSPRDMRPMPARTARPAISRPEGLSIYAELAFSCSNRTVHGVAPRPTFLLRAAFAPRPGPCRAGLFRALVNRGRDAAWPNPTGASVSGTKKDCSWGSMDKGRRARTQGAFESSNAATGDREEDETNRAGASAKGGNPRHRPGTSPLTRRPFRFNLNS